MNSRSFLTTSETDWARIDAMQDEDIDFSDIPEITQAQITRSKVPKVRFGGVDVQAGKRALPVLLDESIIDYFSAQEGELNYHQLINKALLQYMAQNPLQVESA